MSELSTACKGVKDLEFEHSMTGYVLINISNLSLTLRDGWDQNNNMPSQSKDDHSLHSQQQRVSDQHSKETPRKIVTILHFRVPLLQSSKPDTTFQFGQVMDVHLFCKITWMRPSPSYWLLMITSPMDVHLFAMPPEWGPPTPPKSYEWLLP